MSSKHARSELRVVLVGQEKVGKSSAANTILGKREFECMLSSTSLTLSSKKIGGDVEGRRVSVVDTPGLFNTQLSAADVKAELRKAVKLSYPGPHVFLLTLQLGRLTKQEQRVLEILENMLGLNVSIHTMVLFTYGDRLEHNNIEKFIRDDQNLQNLLKRCSGQYHVFNNREIRNRTQVQELLNKIDDLSHGQHYELGEYDESGGGLMSVWPFSYILRFFEWIHQLFCCNRPTSERLLP